MGVPDNAVVVIVIIGAGFTLLVAGAIAKFYTRDRSTELDPFRERSIEQSMYMRNVRQRNLAWMWREARSEGSAMYLSPGRRSSAQASTWTHFRQPGQESGQERWMGSEQTTPRG
jgi:hypothetical protein